VILAQRTLWISEIKPTLGGHAVKNPRIESRVSGYFSSARSKPLGELPEENGVSDGTRTRGLLRDRQVR